MRFDAVASAIQYAIEELNPDQLAGAGTQTTNILSSATCAKGKATEHAK
jgi:hypothetical protein